MNLNALWNSMGYGALWPEFPLALEGQYEGFCYLGLGWILLVGLAAGCANGSLTCAEARGIAHGSAVYLAPMAAHGLYASSVCSWLWAAM